MDESKLRCRKISQVRWTWRPLTRTISDTERESIVRGRYRSMRALIGMTLMERRENMCARAGRSAAAVAGSAVQRGMETSEIRGRGGVMPNGAYKHENIGCWGRRVAGVTSFPSV